VAGKEINISVLASNNPEQMSMCLSGIFEQLLNFDVAHNRIWSSAPGVMPNAV